MTCALPAPGAPPRSHPGTWLFGAAALVGAVVAVVGLVTGGVTTTSMVSAVVALLVAVLPLLAHVRAVPFACPIRTSAWAAGVLLVAFGVWATSPLSLAWGALLLVALWRTRALTAAARTS